MKKLIILALLLTGCASTPMTNNQCKEMGGDTAVKLDGQVRCCKIVEVNKKTYCEEVTPVQQKHVPREFGPHGSNRP